MCGAALDVVTVGQLLAVAVIAGSWAMPYVARRGDPFERFARLPIPLKCLTFALAATVIVVFNRRGPQAFIYFQF
ncbi:MAG: hypothetical protein NTZ32_18525 [Planctomycetales bacterium]|nr:hypothetical protein [Planctomycetales bacterium]